jgi:hypothetical protein
MMRRVARVAFWFVLCHVTASGAAAQTSSSEEETTTRGYLHEISRVESWSFFQPPPNGGDPTYATFANRATLGVRVTGRRFAVEGAFQYAQLLGLSERSIGPGALGSGGFYFFSAEAPAAYQLYFKTLNLRVNNLLSGVSITAGRMGYSSGEESPSGDEHLDDLTRRRIGSRLIGDFEWSVFQRSFDGARVDVSRPSWAANASLLFPTQGGYEESANPTMNAVKLVTASVTTRPALTPNHSAQVFVYHYRDKRDIRVRPDNAQIGPRRADVSVAAFGVSSAGSIPLSGGHVDTVVWLAAQTGRWFGDDHRAWSLALEGGYRFPAAWRPWLRSGVLHASGDDNPADRRHGTFFQMIPSIERYSQSTTYALMNLRDVFAELTLEPHPRVSVRSQLHRLSLVESADRWYYGSGATSRTASFFGFTTHLSGGERGLGTMLESTVDVSLSRAWSIQAYLGWMKGGNVVRQTFAGDRLTFFFFENALRF